MSRGSGYNFAFFDDRVVVALGGGERQAVFAMHLGDGSQAMGQEPLAGRANYFIGPDPRAWRTGVPTFGRVRYGGVAPGIDAVFYGRGRDLEFDLLVVPGADVGRARVRFDGAADPRADGGGALLLAVDGRTIRFSRPVAWQEIDGRTLFVEASYRLHPSGVGFDVGPYDARRPLVIDPVLVYSTHLGRTQTDAVYDVATDPYGSVFVTGLTWSSDFPVTSGAFQSAKAPDTPTPFVTKLNSDGSAILYSTYVGGTGGGPLRNLARAIAVDPNGQAYVMGHTGRPDIPHHHRRPTAHPSRRDGDRDRRLRLQAVSRRQSARVLQLPRRHRR